MRTDSTTADSAAISRHRLTAVTFVALAVLATAACGGGGRAATSSSNSATSSSSTGESEATTTTQAPVADGPKPTCAYIGTDFLKNMQVELTFTNILRDVPSMQVTYALLDGGGTRFLTGPKELIEFPRASEQFRITAATIDKVPPNIEEATIGCKVLAIEKSIDLGFQRATNADTCAVLGADSSGRIPVEVTVTNPFKEAAKLQTWWALQAPGPVRFDTDTDVQDLVGPGESIRISADPLTVPGWIGDGEITCAVLGVWDQGR